MVEPIRKQVSSEQLDPSKLKTGSPWPAITQAGDCYIEDSEQPWVDMEGYPGSAIKVLYADRESNPVSFLYRLGPNQTFPMHEHRCRAFAYTLDGDWSYGDVHLSKGALAVEQVGSTHFPETKKTGFTVFTILIGNPGEKVLLRSQDPETLEDSELDIEYFIGLMKSPS